MRSLLVVVMYKLYKLPTNVHPTAYPRRIDAIGALHKNLKPVFEEISVNVVRLFAQPYSSKGSQISEAIDENHSVEEIVFLSEAMQKRCRWIDAASSEQRRIQQQYRLDGYCSIYPRLFTIDLNNSHVNCDARQNVLCLLPISTICR